MNRTIKSTVEKSAAEFNGGTSITFRDGGDKYLMDEVMDEIEEMKDENE